MNRWLHDTNLNQCKLTLLVSARRYLGYHEFLAAYGVPVELREAAAVDSKVSPSRHGGSKGMLTSLRVTGVTDSRRFEDAICWKCAWGFWKPGSGSWRKAVTARPSGRIKEGSRFYPSILPYWTCFGAVELLMCNPDRTWVDHKASWSIDKKRRLR